MAHQTRRQHDKLLRGSCMWKNSYERIKGRTCIDSIAELSEVVFFRPAKTAKEKEHKDSWRDRFVEGAWLGFNIRTSESIVGTHDGVFRAGAIRRKPPEERWSASFLQELKGCPQQPVPNRESHRMPNYVRPELVGGERPDAAPPSGFTPPVEEPPKVRGLYVRKDDVARWGPTAACKRCRAVVRGVTSSVPHSAECHIRFSELMASTPAGAAKVARVEERLTRETHRIGEAIIEQAEKKRKVEEAEKDESAAQTAAPTTDTAIDAEMGPAVQPSTATSSTSPMKTSSPGPLSPSRRKRQADVPVKDIDPRSINADEAESGHETTQQAADAAPSDGANNPGGDVSMSANNPGGDVSMSVIESGSTPSKAGSRSDMTAEETTSYKKPVDPVISTKYTSRQSRTHHSRPEQKALSGGMPHDELQWRQIGSGAWARTFIDAEKLILTTRGGPCEADIERRIIRDAITGKLIDDCRPDDTADAVMLRRLPLPTSIRVEVIMRDAAKWFRQKHADVVELYSPPRVVQEAGLRAYGGQRLRPGWSLDLTTDDPETGKPWDLGDGKTRTKVVSLINEGKPFTIILSPMCTAFSQIQAINKGRRDPAVIRREIDDAKDHIRWVMKLCALQHRSNRYFVFEHPAGATSWDMAEVKKVHGLEGVLKIKFDMCQFGMEARDPLDGQVRPVQKRTAVLTNSYEIAQRLRRECPNRGADKSMHHQHVKLEGGSLCKNAQVYPRTFCRTICEGIAAQRRMDSMNLVAMGAMSVEELMSMGHDDLHEDHMSDSKYEAYDDVSNEPLIFKLVQSARKEELEYFKTMKVYEYATVDECRKVTGKAPIGTRWIDTNKGDQAKPNYRSRLVAKEYKVNSQPELYAATPPTECMRLIISKAAEKKTNKIIYIDISRAYFYAKSVRPTYVKLPAEDPKSSDESCCARLLMSMYGTRDAALNWHEEYAETLRQAGYVRGTANPCLFYNKQDDISVMVHGDDFLATGDGKAVEKLKRVLSNAYKVKIETLGTDDGDASEIRVLNRVLRRTAAGYRLEADPRHAEAVIRDLGLAGAKASKLPGSKEEKRKHGEVGAQDATRPKPTSGIAACADELAPIDVADVCIDGLAPIATDPATPGCKAGESKLGKSHIPLYNLNHKNGQSMPTGKGRGGDPIGPEVNAIGPSAAPGVAPKIDPSDDDETLLTGEEARLFRGIAARLNYVGPDRPEMQFAIKEAARLMSSPRRCDWRILRKLGRYLIRRPRIALVFNWQGRPCQLDGFSDSDWAGCGHSRKSTSGGVIMLGAHAIKSWSRQQRTIALSSAEAETYGMVACSTELLGLQACARDLGISLGVSVYADASAALGIIKRRGIGKMRHIQTQSLWLQEAHATKRIHFEKIDGSRNPADLLTKHLAEVLMDRHMKVIGALPEDGRAATAPTLASLGINEAPLQGFDAPEGIGEEANSLVQSRDVVAHDRQKSCMRPCGHDRFGCQSSYSHFSSTGGESRSASTDSTAPPPRVWESTARETVSTRPVTSSESRSRSVCLVDVRQERRKEEDSQHCMSVTGYTTKSSHGSSRECPVNVYTEGAHSHDVCRSSLKPKTPITGCLVAPEGVRAAAAKNGSATRRGEPRSALRYGHRHVLKSAWADAGDETESEGANFAAAWSSMKGRLVVRFCEDTSTHSVPPYSEIYGMHPRDFDFSYDGRKIPVEKPIPEGSTRETRYVHDSRGLLTLCESTTCLDSQEEYEYMSSIPSPLGSSRAYLRSAPILNITQFPRGEEIGVQLQST